ENHELRQPSLFGGDSADAGAPVEDRLDWGSLEGMAVLLGDDPLRAIDRFQEIVVTPPPAPSPPPDLEIYVHPTETFPNRSHKLAIWVDGKERTIDRRTSTFSLPLKDLPGETMVTMFKQSGDVNDFELGK